MEKDIVSFIIKYSIVTMCFLLFTKTAFTQMADLEKKTDTVSQKIKVLYNQNNLVGIYALFTKNFKASIAYEDLNASFKANVFPKGKIVEFIYKENKDGFNIYKAKMENGDRMKVLVALDENNNVSGFGMFPYKPDIKESDKRKNYYHDNALKTSIDSLVHKYASNFIETTKSPGLAIGILIGTKSYFYNYGDAKKGEDIHPTKQTVFETGSITKTFTAFLLADAVIKNKVKLDDPITQYLPDSVAANNDLQQITIQQLANHTSGMHSIPDDLFQIAKNASDPYAQYDTQHLFSFLKSFKADIKPATTYSYSNLAFGLLGDILERINKMPLAEQYNQTIFQPFKMNNSFSTEIKDSSMTAQGYDEKGNVTNYWNFKAIAGCGSIKSTTEDLINYAIPFALMPRVNGKYDPRVLLLQKITYKKGTTTVSLGWHFKNDDTPNFIMWHNGGTGGFRSYLGVMPSKKLAVVTLNNSAEEPGSQSVGIAILNELAKAIDGNLK